MPNKFWLIGLLMAGFSLLGAQFTPATAQASQAAIRHLATAVTHGGSTTAPTVTLGTVAALGPDTLVLSGTEPLAKHPTTLLEVSHNGGSRWSHLGTIHGIAASHVVFGSPEDGWASSQPLMALNYTPKASHVFATQNGGHSWKPLKGSLPGTVTGIVPERQDRALLGISGACSVQICVGYLGLATPHASVRLWSAPGAVLAVAQQAGVITAEVATALGRKWAVSLYRFNQANGTWALVGPIGRYSADEVPASATGQLAWSSSKEGLASVYSVGTCTMGGCGLTSVLRTTDGGAQWRLVPSAEISCQFGPEIAANSRREAVVEGTNQAACLGPSNVLFLSRTDQSVFQKRTTWAATHIAAIGFDGTQRMWAVSAAGLLISQNAGQSWTQVYPKPRPTDGIEQHSARVAFGFGDQSDPGALLQSVNGERTWHVLTSLDPDGPVALASGPKTALLVAAVPVMGQRPTSGELVYRAKQGRAFHRVYQPPRQDTLYPAIGLFSDGRGVLLNLPSDCATTCPLVALSTQDGGARWKPLAVSHAPRQLAAAALLSPTHWMGVTEPISHLGAIYRTNDAGRHWQRLMSLPGVLSGGALGLSFPTAEVGYVLVHVHQASGQGRAGMLMTQNGGHTWAFRPLPTSMGVWPSSISFESPLQGSLLDGTTMWKTSDGGAVWSAVP